MGPTTRSSSEMPAVYIWHSISSLYDKKLSTVLCEETGHWIILDWEHITKYQKGLVQQVIHCFQIDSVAVSSGVSRMGIVGLKLLLPFTLAEIVIPKRQTISLCPGSAKWKAGNNSTSAISAVFQPLVRNSHTIM